MIAVRTAEEPTTSHGTVRADARMELGDPLLSVWINALHFHTAIQLTETATQFQIDLTVLFLLTTIRRRGWLFVHCLHWLLVTEPKNNVFQVAFQDNLPTLHPDSAKLHAPTYLTLLTQPLENAFWSVQQDFLLTQTTTDAKIFALVVNSPIPQPINVSVPVPHLITVTITEPVLWHVSWNAPLHFMLRVDSVSVAVQFFLQIQSPTCALDNVWTLLPIPPLASVSPIVSVSERFLTTVQILVLLSVRLIPICMKKTLSVLPSAPTGSLPIQLQDWEAAGLDAQKGSGHNLNLKDAFQHASLDTLVEILPTLVTEHACLANSLIWVQDSVKLFALLQLSLTRSSKLVSKLAPEINGAKAEFVFQYAQAEPFQIHWQELVKAHAHNLITYSHKIQQAHV